MNTRSTLFLSITAVLWAVSCASPAGPSTSFHEKARELLGSGKNVLVDYELAFSSPEVQSSFLEVEEGSTLDPAPVMLNRGDKLTFAYLDDPRYAYHPSIGYDRGVVDVKKANFEISRLLGSGGFSTVYEITPTMIPTEDQGRSKRIDDTKDYALKMFNQCSGPEFLKGSPDKFFKLVDRERLLSKEFDQRFIVNTYGIVVIPRKRKIGTETVREYCTGIIMELASAPVEGIFDEEDFTHEDFATILYGIFGAMRSIDYHGMFNCDVKMENVLLYNSPVSGKLIAKMSDFGAQALVQSRFGTKEILERQLGKCISPCKAKEICIPMGTFMIRSPRWLRAVLAGNDNLPQNEKVLNYGCSTPDVENTWSVASIIIRLLAGARGRSNGSRRPTLGNLWPKRFLQVNKQHWLAMAPSWPLYKDAIGRGLDMEDKYDLIVENYEQVASDIVEGKFMGKRRMKPLFDGKIKDKDEAEKFNKLVKLLRLLLFGWYSVEEALGSDYLQLARTVDYEIPRENTFYYRMDGANKED